MTKYFFLFVAACSFTLVACGSGDPCTATSKCANDPKSTDDQVKACQTAVKAVKDMYTKCTSQIDAAAACNVANQVCGSDGKTDGVATAAKCASETEAVAKCVAG